ncbi:MAG: S8 family serine peptidase [Draconibacterium sp.]
MRLPGVFLIAAVFSFFVFEGRAQNYYWVGFTDKNNSEFALSDPGKYLSERAIQRRQRQQIAIDSLDLPVNKSYIKAVTDLGVEFFHSSKWLNGITVKVSIDSFEYKVKQLPFVKEVQHTKDAGYKSAHEKFELAEVAENVPIDGSLFGLSVYQTSIMNSQYLYDNGYKGEGIRIAVLDAGYQNADFYFSFDSLRANGQILGTRDFVDPTGDIYRTHWHGMGVLSCMGGNVPGRLIGTATKADYWLLRSENANTEFLVEEDNWVVAAEFADSVGCDVINSSLGYTTFYNTAMNHVYAEMDGKTTRATRGANVAAARGMLVFVSAGNEGNSSWYHISAPSDGEKVIAVGAVSQDSVPANFTSRGPAFGGAVKPNISGMGVMVYMQVGVDLGYSNGTSFSSPLVAGAAASLWSAFPDASALQIKQVLEESAHLHNAPNNDVGYGIPDFQKAFFALKSLKTPSRESTKNWNAFPNPLGETLIIQNTNAQTIDKISLSIFTTEGKLLKKWIKPGSQQIVLNDINDLPAGILLLKIESENTSETIRLIKQK